MRFAYSDDLGALKEGTRAFLDGQNPPERLRREGGLELWAALEDMGLVDITASVSLAEAIALFEEVGRAALPEPLADTAVIAAPLLELLGAGSRRPQGARVAICHPDAPYANHADSADFILIVDEQRVVWLEREAAELAPVRSIDPWRKLFIVTGQGETLAEGDAAREACRYAAALGATTAAAELLGLADRMIDLAVAYAGTREQFGQAIGSFQAVKHLLANARVKLEFARPVVYRASVALDSAVAVSHAKVAATDAALFAAEQAIQVHGGMGYTYEADLHYFMKRAWALAGIWGSRERHLAVVEQAVLDGGIAIGPQHSFEC